MAEDKNIYKPKGKSFRWKMLDEAIKKHQEEVTDIDTNNN